MLESKFLTFIPQDGDPTRRTQVITVSSKGEDKNTRRPSTGISLGIIRWYAPWRRYVFVVEPGTLFDSQCLDDIATYLSELMTARQNEKRRSLKGTAK